MKGYILTYSSTLSKRDIININYDLFGKVLSKHGKKYFYPGKLDEFDIFKFSNGCYFLNISNSILNELILDDRVVLYKSDIEIEDLYTCRKLKQEQYKDIFVKNLQ